MHSEPVRHADRSSFAFTRLVGAGAACLVAVAGLTAAPRHARAQTTYDVAATTGAGATDNVQVAGRDQQHVADGFVQLGAGLRLRYSGARASHSLGYRLSWTRYVLGRGADVTANDLAWITAITPTATTVLRFTANGTLSQTSRLAPIDPAIVTPPANVVGAVPFYAVGAGQELAYQPTSLNSYDQTLTVARLGYIDKRPDLPTTTQVTLGLAATRAKGRESFSLTVTLADAIRAADPNAPLFAQGHTFLGLALLGWGHDLSPVWSTLLQAGPSLLFKWGGPGVLAPAATATINYARAPWFASLTAMQTPTPNLYVGEVLISDQVLARLALPLSKRELLYVGGFGGYVYARVASDQASLTRAYDQVFGGLSLIARFQRLPVFASLNYFALSQRGNAVPGHNFSDLARQTVLLNIGGTFAFGPGTPPLFGSVL